MTGKGKQIHLERVDINGDFSGGLHGVGVEINVCFLREAADFFERLDGAELVVGVHDGDENGFGPDGSAQILHIYLSFAIGRQIGDGHALFFEGLAGIEDGFVFDGRGDDVLAGFAGAHSQDWLCHNPEDGVIVRFGAAAGKDDFLGAGADQGGHLFAGGFDGGASALARCVDGSGVGKFGGEIGKHGVEHFRLDGRGGVEIEVDAVHGASHRILPAGLSYLHEVGLERHLGTEPQDRLSPQEGEQASGRFLVNHNRAPPPLVFFKSVDSKGG